jgi:cell wall-associated NlpC family hydrolase
VFYGNANNIHHVGLYLGGGQIINAPTFGKPIQVGPYRYPNDDFYGATRPATQ